MKKRMTIMIIASIIVFGGLIGFNEFKKYKTTEFFKTFKMPPATISTVFVTTEDWQPTLSAIGNFSAVNGVDVNAQQSGHITKIDFTSGEIVKKGKLLVELDQSIDKASLAQAKANLALAQSDYDRQKTLYKKAATATSSLDSAHANLLQSKASVDKILAIISQKNIRAPFDGKLGVRLVNIGEFVSPGTTKLVTLQSQDPLFLQFYLPEHYLSALKNNQEILFNVQGYDKLYFKGGIQALNSKVESNTHNILVQAQIANCPAIHSGTIKPELFNPSSEKNEGLSVFRCNTSLNKKNKIKDFAFIPGMFANIEVMQKKLSNVLVVPHTAITYSLYGNFVYVVKEVASASKDEKSLKVFQQFVKIGNERANKVVVLSGLKKGDQIVNSGQLKLQNGTDVLINNKIKLHEVTNIKTLGQ